MSTITDSLKNFYKKLGGSLSNLGPNSTSADIVDAMAEVYTDKEGTYVEVTEAVTEGTKIATIKTNNVDHDIYAPVELPTVTSEDEGKVLSVDSNGAWIADDGLTELAEDVSDLETASDQYHDDIADLKTADITIGLRIDDVEDDVTALKNKTATLNCTLDMSVTPATITITGYNNWGEALTACKNYDDVKVIGALSSGTKRIFRLLLKPSEPYVNWSFVNCYIATGNKLCIAQFMANEISTSATANVSDVTN